jgi:hypothetical protein
MKRATELVATFATKSSKLPLGRWNGEKNAAARNNDLGGGQVWPIGLRNFVGYPRGQAQVAHGERCQSGMERAAG